MSISDDDSLLDEDDQFLNADSDEIDYYAILNVPRDVSFFNFFTFLKFHHFPSVSSYLWNSLLIS